MTKNTRPLAAAIAPLAVGLSLILGGLFRLSNTARANPGVRHAVPTAQGSGNCSSWANACTLQTALAQAVSGDEIWVRAGVHYPGAAGNREATFTLKNGVALYGGFAGTETSRDQRNWQANVTILSGDIDRNDINTDGNFIAETWNDIQGENSYHVVKGGRTDRTAVLDGFTITAGQADGFFGYQRDGGGMYNFESSPTLMNVTFSGNLAAGLWPSNGGGMCNYDSSPTLTNVTFGGNRATKNGGGLWNYSGSNPILTNVTFSHNSAAYNGGGMYTHSDSSPILTHITFSGNSAAYGGGMYTHSGSNPILAHVAFSGNSAANWGGGMYCTGGSPTLTEVTFSDNSAAYNGGGMGNSSSSPTLTEVSFCDNSAAYNGGGMYNSDSSSPTLTDVTFRDNLAAYGGGMYNVNNSSPTLTNVTFSGNSATGDGGGMFNKSNSDSTLTNAVFDGNSASGGGGMYNDTSFPVLVNIVFSGNAATGNGGGMFNTTSSPRLTNATFSGNTASNGGGIYNTTWSYPTLANLIIWGNTAGGGAGIYNSYSSPSICYSDVQDCGGSGSSWNSACGADNGGNIDADPRLVSAATSNLRLLLSSPCIDAGDSTAVPAGVITDLDGNPRFVDIPGVPNRGRGAPPIVDMGAYEAQIVPMDKSVYLPLVLRNRQP